MESGCLFGWVKITPGAYILRVTCKSGKCSQNLKADGEGLGQNGEGTVDLEVHTWAEAVGEIVREILEFSILETQKLQGSRLQLSFEMFEAVWEFIETVWEFIESGFKTLDWKKQRTFCVINFWHVWILRIAYFSFLYQQIYFEFRSIISCQICLSENLCRSFSFFNLFYQNLSWMSFTK